MAPSPQLAVTVLTSEGVQYNGAAVAVSSFNDQGPFSILPFHTNFISLIQQRLVVFRTRKDFETLSVDAGIVVCRENTVEIYLGVLAEPALLSAR